VDLDFALGGTRTTPGAPGAHGLSPTGECSSRRFRLPDIGGGAKVLWLIFVILLPFLGVFIYLIAESKGMDERSMERAQASQQ
jgi:ABC-type Fe3+ transport system permease subunit